MEWDNRRPAGAFENTIYDLALLLNQDAIAVYLPDFGHGALIGPRAEAWGNFNPEFFLLPDGSRLSARQAA